MTREALEAFGITINSVDIWMKLFFNSYDSRCVAYITAMKEMFNKIHQTMIKALTPKQKFQKPMIDIGGVWYMGKSDKGMTPLKR